MTELIRRGAYWAAQGARLMPMPDDSGLGLYVPGIDAHNESRGVLFLLAWAAEWHRLAQPTVHIGHKYAAALMSTAVPEFEIRAPWRHFMIRVPDGKLITLIDRRGDEDPIQHILCTQYPDRWTYMAIGDHCEYTQMWAPTEKLRHGECVGEHGDPAFAIPEEDHDVRARLLITRLLLNSCLVLADPTRVRPLGKRVGGAPGVAGIPVDAQGQPLGGAYELMHAVSVDCRESVREYLTGHRRTAPVVRWLVRGHWRQQAYGPHHSLRRTQWIEPFWKGADDAPIAIREHDLKRAAPAGE